MIKIYKSSNTEINFILRNNFHDYLWFKLSELIKKLDNLNHKDADILLLMLPAVIIDSQRLLNKSNKEEFFNNCKLKRVSNEPKGDFLVLKKYILKISHFFSSQKYIYSFDNDLQKHEYAKNCGETFRLIRYYEYFDNRKGNFKKEYINESNLINIRDILVAAFDYINFQYYSVNLDNFINLIRDASSYYNFHLENLSGKKLPQQFWSGTLMAPFNRIFSMAIKRNGGTVVGFDHGVSDGFFDNSLFQPRYEFDMCNTFVSYGKHIINGLKNLNTFENRIKNSNSVKIATNSIKRKKPIYSKHYNNKIIFLTNVYNNINENINLPGPIQTNVQIKLQIDILNELEKLYGAKKIIIKFHPDVGDLSKAIIQSKISKEILSTELPFEDLNPNSCVAVFESIQTTAFRSAFIGNWPIIVLEMPNVIIQENIRDILKKRIFFLKCNESNDNEITFNSEELKRSINEAKDRSNNNDMIDSFYPEEL
mgnify:CR=1 FL=1|tara:strand:+ start:15905 stop:17347 length:1443 start_codon:yes stop_codon:yes gene_type:complete